MKPLFRSLAVCIALLVVATAAWSFYAGPMPGWERGGAYDKHYDAAKYESLKGELIAYDTRIPLSGMTEGLVVQMKTRDGQDVDVHLGPLKYVDFLPDIMRPGDRIKVKGAFATISGMPVFMAAKIRKGEVFELKLRSTRTGAPYWDLDRSEIFEESLEQ